MKKYPPPQTVTKLRMPFSAIEPDEVGMVKMPAASGSAAFDKVLRPMLGSDPGYRLPNRFVLCGILKQSHSYLPLNSGRHLAAKLLIAAAASAVSPVRRSAWISSCS